MVPSTFRDLADLNAQIRHWVLEVAGQRLHGTTREPPLERFERERALLKPLPPIAPDLGTWAAASVHRDGHLQFAIPSGYWRTLPSEVPNRSGTIAERGCKRK